MYAPHADEIAGGAGEKVSQEKSVVAPTATKP